LEAGAQSGAPSEMGPGTGAHLVLGHVWGPPSEMGPGTGEHLAVGLG
jgi:hypothetical protein